MPTSRHAEQHAVFWPRSPRRLQAKPMVRRLQTLNGKTIAQLWDYMFRGDEVFDLVEQAIKQRFPDVRFVNWREFGNTHGSDEREVLAGLPKRFKDLGVDAAISAMGC
jgi:hypothetical protein